MTALNELTASEAVAAVSAGQATVPAIVDASLARIGERQAAVKAFAFVDREIAMRQARAARGPLAGVTVGVKDMINTADQPTQHNSNLYVGHRPAEDAAVVAILRAAGAVILGKTDTHEFAAGGRWPLARHPLDPARTPGGSSSGSAAAVADRQVQVALGTQTAGSTIRPGSFCGVVAFKPTFGVVSREGAKPYSYSLDTIGFYARAVEDIALLADVLAIARNDAPLQQKRLRDLNIGVARTAHWDRAEPASQRAVEATAAALAAAGARVTDVTLPQSFAALVDEQRVLMRHEGRAAFLAMHRVWGDSLNPDFAGHVRNTDGYTRDAIRRANDHVAAARPVFDDLAGAFDAVLTPAAIGEAPVGEATGDPLFNRMWTALHVPAITLPGFSGPAGLPIGVQLVAPRWYDAELLQAAALIEPLAAAAGRQAT